MANDIATEIEQMLVEAWGNFFNDYNKKVPKYPELWKGKQLSEKEAKESHWICWNEYDLMFHVGRFFYDTLKKKEEIEEKKGEGKYSNIEIHFEKNINSTNFKDYEFLSRLNKLNENLKMKRGPKVDMIVAYEHIPSSFLLCAEVKYFHSASERYNVSPTQKISEDIKKLKAIRNLNIAERVVFMLFDDYYWFANENTANDIENELEKYKKDEKIRVLSCNSKRKLEKYQNK